MLVVNLIGLRDNKMIKEARPWAGYEGVSRDEAVTLVMT